MGNCIETCMQWQVAELESQKQSEEGFEKSGMMRIKVVLTKEEVEWLIHELKSEEINGKRSLEDLVAELERKRGCVVEERWRPCLESIMEAPDELPEMDRSC